MMELGMLKLAWISRRRGSRRAAWWIAALLAAISGSVGGARAAAPAGPGRIAVAGTYPTGYVGLLARNGLPRDILLDYQMGDRDLVARYDLVIAAGMSTAVLQNAWPGLQAVLARGGSVLLDYSYPSALLREWMLVRRGADPRALRAAASPTTSKQPFRLVGEGNPLRLDVPETEFPSSRMGFVVPIQDPQNSTVLAEYVEPARPTVQRRATFRVLPEPEPQNERLPAIVLQRYGPGKVILCGPALGYGIALAGLDYDALILGMVRMLTSDRAVPQLQPEGPRLARRQSARSLDQPTENTTEAARFGPAPEWPAGPGAAAVPPAGFTRVEPEPAPEFNLSGTVAAAGGDVLLNYWNAAHHVRVSFSRDGIRVARTAGGRSQALATLSTALPDGSPFVLKQRRDRLIVMAGSGVANVALSGVCRGAIAVRGAVAEPRYQPVEPVYFGDDFMRTSDETGAWETRGGTWKTAPVQNPDMGANPFSYQVQAQGAASGLAGYPFWDEYRFSVSVKPESGSGRLGLGIYARDDRTMLLFQARLGRDGTKADGGFSLVRLVDGQPEVLAESAGALAAGQWYRLQVKAQGGWVGAWVDGVKVLVARDARFPGGKIALRVEDAAARFDDVVVEPAQAPEGSGVRMVGQVPSYAGVIDVDSWAGPATPWEPDPDQAGLFWRQGTFHGDVGLRLEVPALAPGSQAVLLLGGDGRTLDSGASAVLRRDGMEYVLELRQGGGAVAKKRLPSAQGFSLGLRRSGERVVALIGDRALLSAAVAPGAHGARLAFRAVGFRPAISQVALWSGNLRDYTFDAAPTDWWVGSGEWDVTNRWSCTPDWSWFGGYSEDVAAIWHKQRLEGDVVLDFYAGPKMIVLNNQKLERLADFNAVLCGDGRSVGSGYAFAVAPDGAGARLLRRGQVVASNDLFRPFAQGHNRWANVRVEKAGAHLKLFVEGQLVLHYQDPEPLPGGYAGIWTRRNGIMLPRITLYFERLGDRLLSLAGGAGAGADGSPKI